MAASVNKVILIGNLGRDPDVRSFASGGQVANVTLATTRKWTDKQSGEKRSETEWHRLVFNGRLAEIAGQYLRKGSQIFVEGSIRTRKWQDQSGQDRYSTEIRVDQMQMLGGREGMGEPDAGDSGYGAGRGSSWGAGSAAPAHAGAAPAAHDVDADVPFAPAPAASRPAKGGTAPGFDDMDDDIPF